MRIDAHLHINFQGVDSTALIKYLDQNRFDSCWLMTWEEASPGKWPYQHLSVEEVFETYHKYPGRVVPMYAPDPHRNDAPERMHFWFGQGAKGCAELKSTVRWESAEAKRLLDCVSSLRIPLLFHMEESAPVLECLLSDGASQRFFVRVVRTNRLWGVTGRVFDYLGNYYGEFEKWKQDRTWLFPGYMLDFASLEIVLHDYPDINFVGHGPLFWKHIAKAAEHDTAMYPKGPMKGEGILWRLLRTYPNLYADISAGSGYNALSRDTRMAEKFLLEFGHKILFGTDNIALGLEELVISSGIPGDICGNIMGDNAYKLIHPNDWALTSSILPSKVP